MPDASYLAMTGAKKEAQAGKTRMAACVARLFQSSFAPNVNSTLADFIAAEADYDGYVALTIATWADPVLAGAGYVIFAPTQTFRWEHDTDDVGNQIGGLFIVLSSGELYQYTVFDPTRPISGPDQAIIVTPSIVFAAG